MYNPALIISPINYLGFSTKELIFPFSSERITPYLEGSSTLVKKMVPSFP